MKKLFLVLFLFIFFYNFAQDKLRFDKRFVQSEDKWITFQPDSTGTYNFGFIYIDSQAGLTLDYAGSFTIDSKGKFILKKKELEGSMKYRLEPNNVLVAIIPESHYKELDIIELPEWLKFYKEDENTIERLYNWGYMYNGWNECEKALTFLEKAEKINPDYKGLRVELAFSYNCLEKYQKAIDILTIAIKKEPNDAYTNKELIYSLIHNNQLEEAILLYTKSVNTLTDTTYNGENSFNILGEYYRRKNIEKFKEWITKTQVDKDNKYGSYVEKLKNELLKK